MSGRLPKDWRRCALGDALVDVRSGFASGENLEDGVIQVRMNNVTVEGGLDWAKVRRVPEPAQGLNGLALEKGDILFNHTNSPELVGKSAVFPGHSESVTFSNHFLRLRPEKSRADSGYLARWLNQQWQQKRFWGMCRQWVNQATVSKDHLLALELPLAPLPEQRRIAAILDAADGLRQKRRQALQLFDQLAQSMFIEMFGDLSLNDRGWRMAEVQDFVAGFESGKSLVADDEEDTTSKYRVLKVSAVTSLFYRPDESKPLPPDYVPPDSHIVRQGDLLFSRANTSQLIGATALVDHTPPNHVLPDKIWRFVWHDETRADPHFVWHLFRQRRFRDAISSRATGTSGSMKNISQDKVLSIPIALPPLDLQQEFGRQLKATLNSRVHSETALQKQEVLFSSLQHRAFRGEL